MSFRGLVGSDATSLQVKPRSQVDLAAGFLSDYYKLLSKTEEGRRDEIQAVLQECFPDINAPIDQV